MRSRHSSLTSAFAPPLIAGFALALTLTGCGKSHDPDTTASVDPAAPNMEADLAQTIAAQPEFYLRRNIAALPANLDWQDGSDLPEFADPNAKKGGTFYSNISDFPRTLRTMGPDATGGIRPFLLDYVEPYFIHPHPNFAGSYYPGLARRWAVDHPTRTLYVQLDPAARWSDGHPVTTADVEFSFYLFRSPHLRAPWYNDFFATKYESLILFDELTFAVTFPEDKPDLEKYLSISPYPRHAYQDFGSDWIERYQWRVMPKLGAYQVHEKDIKKGRSITLTRDQHWWAQNKRFFRGRFNPDRYQLDVIRDPNKAAEAFARGDIDLLNLDSPKFWYETLNESQPDIAAGRIQRFKFYNRMPRAEWGLWINSRMPGLDQLDVRLGLHHATNMELVCAQYFRGDAEVMQTRSDGYPWRVHPTITHRPFDPVKARAYFAAAGYDRQGPDGVLMNAAGHRLAFTITGWGETRRDLLTILKQEALKAGVEYRLEILDSTTAFKKMQEKNHELALLALAPVNELYPRYWETFHGSNAYEDAYLDQAGQPVTSYFAGTPNPHPTQVRVQSNNMTSTFIPELDRLIETYDRATTLDEIKTLAAQIEKIIHDDGMWINGWATPFYRGAFWRYIKWPAGFNGAATDRPEELFLFWVDSDERAEVARARNSGQTYPADLLVFDQFKTP